MNTFNDRVARLEEQLVPKSAEDHLRDAELQLAAGQRDLASVSLTLAKSRRFFESLRGR